MFLKLKVILILLLLQFSLHAQIKQEIGVILASVHQSVDYSNKDYNITSLNGITYKHYDGNSIFRFSAQFKLNKSKSIKNVPFWKNISQKLDDIVLKLGLEKQFKNKWITPYVATDLMLLKQKSKFFGNELMKFGIISTNEMLRRQNQLAIGIAPTIGFKIEINKSISLNIETSIELIHLFNRNNTRSSPNKSLKENLDFYYNPINLFSFNVKL